MSRRELAPNARSRRCLEKHSSDGHLHHLRRPTGWEPPAKPAQELAQLDRQETLRTTAYRWWQRRKAELAPNTLLDYRWRLGHTDARLTLNLYAQVMQRQRVDEELIWRLPRFPDEPETRDGGRAIETTIEMSASRRRPGRGRTRSRSRKARS